MVQSTDVALSHEKLKTKYCQSDSRPLKSDNGTNPAVFYESLHACLIPKDFNEIGAMTKSKQTMGDHVL